jgi:hypothetical protein
MRMRHLAAPLLLVSSTPAVAAAQAPEPFPEYTIEQRWQRAAFFSDHGMIAALAFSKQQTQSIESFATFLADTFVPTWGAPGSGEPFRMMHGIRRNWLSYPAMEFEILEQSDESITARANRPWVQTFGEQGEAYGVSVDEFERSFRIFNERLADHLGLAYNERREGGRIVMTISRR